VLKGRLSTPIDQWPVGANVYEGICTFAEKSNMLQPGLLNSRTADLLVLKIQQRFLLFSSPCRSGAQPVLTSPTTRPGSCNDTYGSRESVPSNSIPAYRALGSNAGAAITPRHEKTISGGTDDEIIRTSPLRLARRQKERDIIWQGATKPPMLLLVSSR
jgi:hypothetical protein